ncbi:MAG: hypothetical protein AAB393_07830 [Bacteroidota bacterium]
MNATRIPTLALILVPAAFLLSQSCLASDESPLMGYTQAQLDSLARQLGRELSKVTTPEVESRKHARQRVQRNGYGDVLLELLRGDSLGSLLAFLKLKLQIEFFLPHDKVYVYRYVDSLFLFVPIVFRYDDGTELIFETKKVKLAIKEDWRFPSDPWRKEMR